jgi:DNA-directed RNA polymerase subunit E'/Rpb7
MGKRHRDETPEQRAERKCQKREEKRKKKELKKRKKQEKRKEREGQQQKETINDDGKGFFKKRLDLTVSLLPAGLANVAKSVEDSLRLLLLKYSDGVGGILMAFDNLTIPDRGMILDELPHVHYAVTADCLVFCPAVNSRLTGVVTESFHSHLALTVHQYFNASVSAEQLRRAGFEFDAVTEQWYFGETSNSLSAGDQVKFVCIKIHESGGIISIDGSEPSVGIQ